MLLWAAGKEMMAKKNLKECRQRARDREQRQREVLKDFLYNEVGEGGDISSSMWDPSNLSESENFRLIYDVSLGWAAPPDHPTKLDSGLPNGQVSGLAPLA